LAIVKANLVVLSIEYRVCSEGKERDRIQNPGARRKKYSIYCIVPSKERKGKEI
jgi:hypothetical protein